MLSIDANTFFCLNMDRQDEQNKVKVKGMVFYPVVSEYAKLSLTIMRLCGILLRILMKARR